ncbi:HAD family phosphatase [Lentzea sp. NPDC004782]|uniref:HAD family hydrolase n=1 Tax=Lentzea sp. NPDC004782 TaxID=3154458 RepID=UPI0033B603C3
MTDSYELLHRASAVLFDFDGPVCSVFAGYPAPTIAGELLQYLLGQNVELTSEVASETDPMEVLRWTGANEPGLTAQVEDRLSDAERKAVETAAPTPFSTEAIQAARSRGQRVAIVSNNSAGAVEKYLSAHGLTAQVELVVGRAYAEPSRMKPNPEPLLRAVEAFSLRPEDSVLIGDALTDIEACKRAGVRSVGYAKDETREVALTSAGAELVITSMSAVAGGGLV